MLRPGNESASVSGLTDMVFRQVFNVLSVRSATIQVTGTFVATIVAEVSNDDGESPSNWTTVLTIMVPGIYVLPIGYGALRFRCTSYTSGTATIGAIFSQEEAPALESDLLGKYQISELDKSSPAYYGFVANDGSWYILQLSDTAARYARGAASFATNWSNRAALTYDTFNNVF